MRKASRNDWSPSHITAMLMLNLYQKDPIFEDYVGMVVRAQSDEELTVNFMRKSIRPGKFVFPHEPNVETVDKSEVVKVLKQPKINKRSQYIFAENMKIFKNMHWFCQLLLLRTHSHSLLGIVNFLAVFLLFMHKVPITHLIFHCVRVIS